MKHIVKEREEIQALYDEFEKWLEAEEKEFETELYGRAEFKEVFRFERHGQFVSIHYGDKTHYRELRSHPPYKEPYILCYDLTWSGDDCDYYGEVLCFLAEKFN